MSPGASEGEAQTEVTQTEVARTASRGLFRRRPERPARPAARPQQRRVAELIAEAERDRVAPRPDPAAERSAGPARPGRPGPGADDPARGRTAGAGRDAAGFRAPSLHERRAADGGEGSRSNGFVPRGLTHDEFGMPPVVDDGDAAPTGYIPNGAAYGTNGSANGASYWANGAGYGPWPEEPAVHDVPLDRADDHPPAGQRHVRQRHARERWVRERCVRRRWVCRRWICRRCVCDGADGGAYADRGYQDDSSPPAWPSLGAYGYDRPFGPDREPGAGRELAADRDHVAGAGSDPDLWIEATAWASVVGSGAAPAAEAADVGADDWTVPMPVVRAAPVPEPEPVRPDRPSGAPRHRTPSRARPAHQAFPPGSRGAGRRVAGPDAPAGDTRAVAAGASAGRAAAVAVGRVRMGGRRDVGPWGTGPGRARLGPAPARRPPRRRTRRRPTDRSARRHASAHGRHSEERDDVAGRADRPRHRRPEH